jgi:hypothetical protein
VFQAFSSRRKIHFPKSAGLGLTTLVDVLVVTGFMRFQLDKNSATPQLIYEVRRNKEQITHEREKMMLQLENALLRFERRLSAAPKDTTEK